MNDSPVSLVVTDLDGTLWGHDEVIPEAHREALGELERRGMPVLAATARRPRFTAAPLRRNGFGHLPMVCVDGSIGLAEGNVFHRRQFSIEHSLQCLDVLSSHDLTPVAYVLDEHSDIIVNEKTTTSPGHRDWILPDSRPADLDELAQSQADSSPFYCFSMLGLPHELLVHAAKDLEALNIVTSVLAPELTYGQSGLYINPLGESKWSGVLSYCERQRIDPTKVLTIGDGANDVEMHKASAISVGIEGGHSDALAVSDHVVGPPASGGWAQLLDLL